MKILYIHEYFTNDIKSGANIIAFMSHYKMIEKGNKVFFWALERGKLLEQQEINKYFPKSYADKKGLLNRIHYRINRIYNFEAEKKLEKVLDMVKPDIVHIHSLIELSYSILKPIKKRHIPCVMTTHDGTFVCPILGKITTGEPCSLCSTSVLNCIKNKCSFDKYSCSIYVSLRLMVEKYLRKKYPIDYIIFPSQALLDYFKKANCISAYSKNIPNALDPEFTYVKPNYANKGYFLFVGGLSKQKGVGILLDAIKHLPLNIEFRIVGAGTDEKDFKDFSDANNLFNVKFLGKKNRKELIDEYQNCIALIVPSNCFEIFGMINIEAFINGKPVIASNIGGIPEIVEHNKNGLLFEPGNVEQLKECILKYWNNPDLVVEHGKNAYQKVISKYTQELYYQNLKSIYNKLLSAGEE